MVLYTLFFISAAAGAQECAGIHATMERGRGEAAAAACHQKQNNLFVRNSRIHGDINTA